ncbi:hypothetical protein CROQUDRAFT_658981 [Cronartium quercuum f. sp. fusiforme G11]|uniref:Uncharacterized protein n=1 Tax=Cronartium quercuum f. sp. fusiforme G11 TaxID=708437 RepID=A0A9P6NJ91_9BASI|nr:hypothetical protein CROQUDRAFT_658981 [Cronartium quercuum f. sp. fusiforme G11]
MLNLYRTVYTPMLHSVSHSTCLSAHTASCFSLLNSSSTHTHLTTLFLTQLVVHTQVI